MFSTGGERFNPQKDSVIKELSVGWKSIFAEEKNFNPLQCSQLLELINLNRSFSDC